MTQPETSIDTAATRLESPLWGPDLLPLPAFCRTFGSYQTEAKMKRAYPSGHAKRKKKTRR